MTGYEATRRAVEFAGPDHLPVCRDSYSTDLEGDVAFVFLGSPCDWKFGEAGTDEWGCRWEKTDVDNIGQVTGHPLKEWNGLDSFSFPDRDDPVRYRLLDAILDRAKDRYVVLCNGSAMFERMTYMRGFAELLEDLHLERGRVEELADRILEFQLGVIENISRRFASRIHGFRVTDDWGSQSGPFISPALWDEVFGPRYRKLFRAVHGAGMHSWMHTCGKVNVLIRRLMDAGLDVINLEQPALLGIEEVGREFGGKICFESHCDIQVTLPVGNTDRIREEARSLLGCWSRSEGGFILGDCAAVANGISPAAKECMIEAFKEYDPWLKRKAGAA